MKNQMTRMTYVALALMAVLLAAFVPGNADAVVAGPTNITIKKACISMPDGTVTAPTGTPAITCPEGTIVMWLPYDNGGAAYLAPGSFKITAAEGDSLTITVQNELGIPVSLYIAGQMMSPNNGPVWFSDINNPYGSTVTSTTPGFRNAGDVTSRVRSFTHETPAGAAGAPGTAQTYIWPSLKAGTYLIMSGTHPSLQGPMGIYGVLVVSGAAWPAADQEVTLLFSEIDPAIHNAANDVTKSFPSTNDQRPKYFLINGKPFPGNNPIPIGATGSTTLLRFVNAGIDTYIPMLQGQSMQVIAEDGNLKAANLQFTRYSVDLHAGKTFDGLLTNPADPGYIPVYDRRLYMSNAAQAPGGMLAYLELSDGAQNQLTVTTGGTGKGRVVAESMPGGINCDSSIVPPAFGATDCTQSYNAGTELKLVAYPNPGALLNTWAGCDSVTSTNECLVTMDAAKSVTATFNAVASVTLIAPANNAQVPAGSTYMLTWAAPANAATYKLRYSLNNGATWVLIGENITGNSFFWIVPTPRKNNQQALVRLTAFNKAGTNIGSDTNTVNILTLVIVAPVKGDIWTSGTVNNLHDIVWQTFATPGLVKSIVIKYSKNNGSTWKTVATLDNSSGVYDNGGTYHWEIDPQVGANKPNSRVKVILKDAAGKNIAVATSKKFTITP